MTEKPKPVDPYTFRIIFRGLNLYVRPRSRTSVYILMPRTPRHGSGSDDSRDSHAVRLYYDRAYEKKNDESDVGYADGDFQSSGYGVPLEGLDIEFPAVRYVQDRLQTDLPDSLFNLTSACGFNVPSRLLGPRLPTELAARFKLTVGRFESSVFAGAWKIKRGLVQNAAWEATWLIRNVGDPYVEVPGTAGINGPVRLYPKTEGQTRERGITIRIIHVPVDGGDDRPIPDYNADRPTDKVEAVHCSHLFGLCRETHPNPVYAGPPGFERGGSQPYTCFGGGGDECPDPNLPDCGNG